MAHCRSWGKRRVKQSSISIVSVAKELRQFVPCQPLVRVSVLGPRLRYDFGRQLRPGSLLVPADLLQIITNILLVKRRLRAAGLVTVQRPETRRIRRKRFVNPKQIVAG